MDKPVEPLKIPQCPYCGARPCPVALNVMSFGPETFAGAFFCGKCEKILTVAPLPKIQAPEEKPLNQQESMPPLPLVVIPGRDM